VAAPNFNASNDAAALRKAMKGFGTDEDAIIEVLCRRTNAQRMEIVKTFKTAYGKDLLDDIRSECRNNFLGVLVALLTPKIEFYARELYEAMHGEGTDEDVLIEVMCYQLGLRSNLRQDVRRRFARRHFWLFQEDHGVAFYWKSRRVDGC